jgi:hypothetical protein
MRLVGAGTVAIGFGASAGCATVTMETGRTSSPDAPGTRELQASTPGLKARRLRKALRSPNFLAELDHLFKRPAMIDGDFRDAGAMCRDTAVVTAMIAGAMGLPAAICTGRASLLSPINGNHLGVLTLDQHSWVRIAGFGVCDLSPPLGFGPYKWGGGRLIGSQFVPDGSAKLAYVKGDEAAYQRAMEDAGSRPDQCYAIYLKYERRPFDNLMFVNAVNFAQSPLTRDLSRQPFFSLDILGKSAIHLWNIMRGRSAPLRGMSQLQSWAAVAAIESRVVERLRQKIVTLTERLEWDQALLPMEPAN